MAPASLRIAQQQLRGLTRRHPKLDAAKFLRGAESKLLPAPAVKLSLNAGDEECLRGIAKIAVGFYSHVGGNLPGAAVEYIKRGVGGPFVFLTHGHRVLETKERDIVHHLEVVANQEGVHVYIQLFSVAGFYVRLSTEPQTETIHAAYTYDCLSAEEILRQSDFRAQIDGDTDFSQMGVDLAGVGVELKRLLLIRAQKSADAVYESAVTQAMGIVKDKFQVIGQAPTVMEFLAEIQNVMEPLVLQWARNASENNRKRAEAEFLKTSSMPTQNGGA